MSVEAFLIAELISEGSIRKALQAGIGEEDFDLYDEEFSWLVTRTEKRLPITLRAFKLKFPDFEFVRVEERIQDLIEELKREQAFTSAHAAVDEFLRETDHDNIYERIDQVVEIFRDARHKHNPVAEVDYRSGKDHLKEQKEISILRESGQTVGIPTGLKNLDHHWGGLQPGFLYCILGRPGDAKSFMMGRLATSAMLDGRRVGFFSPEMNERQHRCRFATLLSAEYEIQKALGLKGAFRNRALMDGAGYNYKTYSRFIRYIENLPGEIVMFTQKYRRQKMTPSYIEARIEARELEMVIVDPIYKLKSPRRRESKREEIQDVVDALQDISKGFNIPVVISNQASRALVGSRGEAPSLDTSFGSDAPAQESDTVLGIKHFSEERLMKLSCSKNRFGEPFKFDVAFHPNVGKMDDVTPIRGDYLNSYDPEAAAELQKVIEEEANV